MGVRFKNFKLNKFISSLVVCVLIISNLMTIVVNATGQSKASKANTIQSNYINLMKGGKITDRDSVGSIASYADLQNVSLFLSNAYFPYLTSLDGDSEYTNKKTMVDLLMNIGMNEESAGVLVDKTYEASLESASQLYVKISDLPTIIVNEASTRGLMYCNSVGVNETTFSTDAYKSLVNDDGSNAGYTPMTLFMWYSAIQSFNNASDSILGSLAGKSLSLYYKNSQNNTMQEAFVLNEDTVSFLCEFIGRLDDPEVYGKGAICNAVVNGDISSVAGKDSIWTGGSVASKRKFGSLVSFFQNMYVDWVGNILVDLGDQRVIVYPACINPVTFTRLDGTRVPNMLSSFGLNSIGKGYIYNSETKSCQLSHNTATFSMPLYLQRGLSVEACWDNGNWVFNDGTAGDLRSALRDNGKVYVGFSSNNTLGSDEWGKTSYINRFNKTSRTFNASNTLSNFLVYESISTEYSESDNSVITSDSLFNSEDYINKGYFCSTAKFSTTDTFDNLMVVSTNDIVMCQNMFLTYTFAFCNQNETTWDASTDATTKYVDMKFNNVFPPVNKQITWEIEETQMQEEIMNFIYYLLHPKEGVKYVATLIKNKVSGIIVGWHEDVVGSSDSNSTTGMTQYLGFSGYVTTPNLYDINWFAWVLDSYDSIIIYVIMLMSVILLCYVLTGAMTLQRGIIGLFLFSILAFLPPIAVNSMVNTSNKVSDSIYSTKFDYWALCQLETYIEELGNLQNAKTTTDYITRLMAIEQSEDLGGGETFYSGTKLKWLSPKKFNDLYVFSSEVQERIDSANVGLTSFTTSLIVNGQDKASSTEDYIESDTAGYLYRDYCDIYRYASCSYNLYTTYNYGLTVRNVDVGKRWSGSNKSVANIVQRVGGIREDSGDDSREYLYKYVMANMETSATYKDKVKTGIRDTSSLNAIRKGFMVNTTDKTMTNLQDAEIDYYSTKGSLASTLLLNYSGELIKVNNSMTKLENSLTSRELNITPAKITKSNSPILFGLRQKDFSFSVNNLVAMKNSDSESVTKILEDVSGSVLNSTSMADESGFYQALSGYYYGLYTESPFYYFNFNVRDQMETSGNGYTYKYNSLGTKTGAFKKMVLTDNQSYFFNLSKFSGDGYGELRDFMNMHDLFYYIIPSLRNGNDLLNKFESVYGLHTYDDCNLNLNSDGKITYNGVTYSSINDDSLKTALSELSDGDLYKFWHDFNVRTVYNAYCSWLNLMYACDYADTETINVAGKRFTVTDPLDPTCYYILSKNGKSLKEGRYMVFSRSEMAYYGLKWNDLTKVEQKIITVQDNVYKESLDLMNYYTLSDEVLINGYAMIQLFEFNKEFSQSSLVSEGITLYPQGYELKAFTYDAYLRLIIAEASGDSLMTTGENVSIYQRVLEKTSLFFGFALLINDVLAVYIIPAFKLFFLVVIVLLSIAMIIASAVKLELNILNVTWKSVLAPILSFGAINISLSFIVSLFMSNGAEGVTKSSETISLGDPTMAICLMIALNAIVVVLYWKICKKCFKDLITYTKAIFADASSKVVDTFGKIAKTAIAGKAMGKEAGKALGHSTAKQRGADNRPNVKNSSTGGLSPAVTGGIAGGIASDAVSDSKGAKHNYDERAKGLGGGSKTKEANQMDKDLGKDGYTRKAENKYNKLKDDLDKKREDKYKNSNTGKYDKSKSDAKDRLNNSVKAFRNIGDAKNTRERIGLAMRGASELKSAGKAGVSALKYGVKSAPSRAVKGVGRKLDNATGNRVGNLVSDVKNSRLGALEYDARKEKEARLESKKKELHSRGMENTRIANERNNKAKATQKQRDDAKNQSRANSKSNVIQFKNRRR